MTEAKRIAGNIIFLEPQSLAAKTPTLPFYFGANTIGRRAECLIRIQELSVSSNHAVLNVTSKSITISDMNSRNGVKINSEQNKIAQNTEIAIDGGMIVYLGDVKCKFQRVDAQELADNTLPSRREGKKIGKNQEIKNLLSLDDDEEEKDLQQMKKGGLDMKSKQEMPDQFSISEDFSMPDRKAGGKANSKKDTKKNSKVIIQETQEIKEEKKAEKKVEKPVQDKKKQTKRESLERRNGKKNEENDPPAIKISKPEEKEKEKQKPKGAKESKQVAANQVDKKSLQKEDVKPNISKDKSDKSKAATVKQKQKPKESKQPEKPKERKTEKQQKKSKSLFKQASKDQQREQIINKKERKKSLHLSFQETRQEQQQQKPSPSRSKKQSKVSDGEKTKRRTQHRKRLPSDQLLPARRSFMNKRIMASGFILNLNKKYFCAIETPEDGFDYLIMKEYKRTYKALFAISHGIPIIRYDWIRESQYFERTLKPESYYFKDLEAIYSAIDKVKDGLRVFRGLEFFLGSDEYHLKVEDIEMLIYSCGGEICRKVGKLSPKEKEQKNKVAIVRNKDASNTKAYEQQLKAVKKMGFDLVYTIEMILDSCEKQAIEWSNNEVKLR